MTKPRTRTTELKRKSGTVPPRHRYPWTEGEDALLRELHGTMTAAQIAQRLDRSPQTVQQRITLKKLADRSGVCRRCGQAVVQAKVGRPRLYCAEGTDCYNARTLARQHELNPLAPQVTKNCRQCQGEFVTTRQRRDFCTNACGKRWWHLQQQALPRGLRRVDDPGVYEQILALREEGRSLRSIGRELGIGYTSISRVAKQGYTRVPLTPWNEENEQYVIDHVGQDTAGQMARVLGMTTPQVAGRIHKLRQQGRIARSAS